MKMIAHLIVFIFFCFSCGQPALKPGVTPPSVQQIPIINASGKTLETRFNAPEGFQRVLADSSSFGYYLRHVPLKPAGSKVKYYNGLEKDGEGVYAAVVDLPIGNKDLHQCADAVMRLRAEYLYSQKQYDKIHFNFTNGFRCDYSEWMKGKRVVVSGNNVSWKQSAQASNAYKDFWSYLEMVFSYAGSLSLSKELKSVKVDDIQPGDVFIHGGSPGHAEIVVDVAFDAKTGKKIFMLAQSYMPAQETQILINPQNEKLSPWYSVDLVDPLQTPEYYFAGNELMRFQE